MNNDTADVTLEQAGANGECTNGKSAPHGAPMKQAPDTELNDSYTDDSGESTAPTDGASEASSPFDPTKKYHNVPQIVIAGRPNVGKSTLFNRLLHARRAITDPTPGVTRDPISEDCFLSGYPVRIMDTGGFKLEREVGTMEAVLDELVVEKTISALKTADLILLLLEAGTITAEDEEFIALLRPYWHKVVAAVNKTEGGRLEEEAYNFYRYGFDELLFISAEHGDRIPELSALLISKLDFTAVKEGEEAPCIRVAIVGKPNTGKSTLANRLTHSEASIVSDYAGTTRDVVEGDFSYRGTNFHILDTAGIRRKAKVTENVEYYSVNRAIKSLDEADIVFHMIDAQEGLAEQDKKIVSLACERGLGVIFVLNKWDTQEQDRKTFRKAEENMKIMFGQMSYAPVVAASALEGKGIKDLLNTAIEVYGQLTRKIETGVLNTALKDWVASNPPPASRAGGFKVRYIVQTSAKPVKFLLFCTRPEAVPQPYVAFLKNRIRRDLGYDKIPIELELKASRKTWETYKRNRDGRKG